MAKAKADKLKYSNEYTYYNNTSIKENNFPSSDNNVQYIEEFFYQTNENNTSTLNPNLINTDRSQPMVENRTTNPKGNSNTLSLGHKNKEVKEQKPKSKFNNLLTTLVSTTTLLTTIVTAVIIGVIVLPDNKEFKITDNQLTYDLNSLSYNLFFDNFSLDKNLRIEVKNDFYSYSINLDDENIKSFYNGKVDDLKPNTDYTFKVIGKGTIGEKTYISKNFHTLDGLIDIDGVVSYHDDNFYLNIIPKVYEKTNIDKIKLIGISLVNEVNEQIYEEIIYEETFTIDQFASYESIAIKDFYFSSFDIRFDLYINDNQTPYSSTAIDMPKIKIKELNTNIKEDYFATTNIVIEDHDYLNCFDYYIVEIFGSSTSYEKKYTILKDQFINNEFMINEYLINEEFTASDYYHISLIGMINDQEHYLGSKEFSIQFTRIYANISCQPEMTSENGQLTVNITSTINTTTDLRYLEVVGGFVDYEVYINDPLAYGNDYITFDQYYFDFEEFKNITIDNITLVQNQEYLLIIKEYYDDEERIVGTYHLSIPS